VRRFAKERGSSHRRDEARDAKSRLRPRADQTLPRRRAFSRFRSTRSLSQTARRAVRPPAMRPRARANLFPRQGAVETSGTSRTRQIICRKGPERVGHKWVGTFAGKFQATFGQLPVVLGDQHRVFALAPLAKGSRHCSFRDIAPCGRDHRGGVLIQRASGRRCFSIVSARNASAGASPPRPALAGNR